MKLHYTPRSHFARKVRILIDALDLDVELIDAGNVAEGAPEKFGSNPLMKVPTLIDGDRVVFDSDQIASYLVRKFDPSDRFNVLTSDVETLNARAVMNGVMSAEVELVMADRTGIDTKAYSRFDKHRETIKIGLDWLESHAEFSHSTPSYSEFHLVSMWNHLVMMKLLPTDYTRLRNCVEELSTIGYIAQSAPVANIA